MGFPPGDSRLDGGPPLGGRFLRPPQYTRNQKLAIILRKFLAIDVGEVDIYQDAYRVADTRPGLSYAEGIARPRSRDRWLLLRWPR
jgi:hypothetical protein